MDPAAEGRRRYIKRRGPWASLFMKTYYPGVKDWDVQVPIFDLRGIPKSVVDTFGPFYFERSMPRADIIALPPNELILVEMHYAPTPHDVGALDFYIDAIQHDDLHKEWRRRKLTAIFVSSAEESRVRARCEEKGYKFIVLEPPPVS